MIWKQAFTLEALGQVSQHTLVSHLGITFTAYGDDYLEATMPVDERTFQPARLLHGGASVALAETLGSVASQLCLEDMQTHMAVGVEINANHLKSATGGLVTGRAMPLRIGRSLHVWQIDIRDEAGSLICVSRLTIAVVKRRR
ncbi:hotdog fold thioesterase [Phaeodactylibacter luteus]|uniref:Hotdog fold thioesterase n=1 Tax=Phaeodactylibacter luteus TaxID=1564516 RepID=A0A5C6S3U9_9BACT|nr:hotdog fold thioesterase [Phaeodactylibacter luteus]TXB68956.1 hotdog fold thioesterase [Phaeodactylibacter luteus]